MIRLSGSLDAISTVPEGFRNMSELTRKCRIDLFECLVDLLTNLRTSEDNLAADEDQKDDLRLDHAIDEAREEFRLV